MDHDILKKTILKAEEEDYTNEQLLENVQYEALDAAGGLSAPLEEEQRQMLNRLSAWFEK